MTYLPTPSQTVGPFFHIALPGDVGADVVPHGRAGAVRIIGSLVDGAGEPVPDGLIEIWQADGAGRYAHPDDYRDDVGVEEGFTGFARCATDESGRFEFHTVKPGPVPGSNGDMQAPHIVVGVLARGLLKRLVTRIYFPDEEEANAIDPVLSSVDNETLRSTLVARSEGDVLRFDIKLQGEGQTAFFDV